MCSFLEKFFLRKFIDIVLMILLKRNLNHHKKPLTAGGIVFVVVNKVGSQNGPSPALLIEQIRNQYPVSSTSLFIL